MIELAVVPSIESAVSLYFDNNGAVIQAKEPRSHQKFKHIERHYHIIREIVERGDVAMQKIASAEKLADSFTKPMLQAQLDRHLEKISLRYCNE